MHIEQQVFGEMSMGCWQKRVNYLRGEGGEKCGDERRRLVVVNTWLTETKELQRERKTRGKALRMSVALLLHKKTRDFFDRNWRRSFEDGFSLAAGVYHPVFPAARRFATFLCRKKQKKPKNIGTIENLSSLHPFINRVNEEFHADTPPTHVVMDCSMHRESEKSTDTQKKRKPPFPDIHAPRNTSRYVCLCRCRRLGKEVSIVKIVRTDWQERSLADSLLATAE